MTKSPGNPNGGTALPDYRDLLRNTTAFDAIIAEDRLPVSVRTGGQTDQGWSMLVSSNYLEVMAAPLLLGRYFTDSGLASGGLPVLVSERFWNNRLGGGASLDGGTIGVNGHLFSVLGVVRDGSRGRAACSSPICGCRSTVWSCSIPRRRRCAAMPPPLPSWDASSRA